MLIKLGVFQNTSGKHALVKKGYEFYTNQIN